MSSVGIVLTLGTQPTVSTAQSAAATPPESAVVATIGTNTVTTADVIGQDPEAFEKLRAEHELKLRQLQVIQEQDRYALLKKQTDRFLDAKALELEAKARGKSGEALLAAIKVAPVTAEQRKNFFAANEARTNKTYAQLEPEITGYLANQNNSDATRRFYDGLRARHHVVSVLEPYRMNAEAKGPVRGDARAPITVIEFADFQCPFCRQAEDTLHVVMARHPNDIRVVFRQLPLASIHPNALTAARAGVCADRQGKFWPMHDAMYDNQNALSETAVKDTAGRLGLDQEAFNTCLGDEGTTKSIFADIKAADELNITGTPFFLVNGRPINGNVPADQFESIVTEELRRNPTDKRT